MKAPHNTLVLKRHTLEVDGQPAWAWTQRASAQVRISETRASDKDQCLFLRGFLITASERWWTHLAPTAHRSNHMTTRPLTPQKQPFESVSKSQTPPLILRRRTKPTQGTSASVDADPRNDLPQGQATLTGQYPPFCINKALIRRVGFSPSPRQARSHDPSNRWHGRELVLL
ncbi:hypothetical protein BKA70DRAFT_1327284 [Coprinopsis sp. MPI-PUGE-AT-0042]|nr:hypothetical protein BKA70DRAFT_1327284 [Coprinopsis sp. MPI-PUGE-AT-0042]